MMLNIGLLLGFFFKCLFDEKKEENVGGIICLSGEKKVSVEWGYMYIRVSQKFGIKVY